MMKQVIFIFILFYTSLDYSFSVGFKNPILLGFHPDPSICRVDSDYYLVTSTFEFFPGVPIYHSKDLVNWECIGHCLTRKNQLELDGCPPSTGIYAPTIRFHNGIFYMVTTNVSGGGNFLVYTKDPAEEWSEPVWLEQPGIDPFLHFEDERCYLVSNPDNMITVCEIDPMSGKQLSESKAVWGGSGGRYPEGPRIFKKDGWYYLLISEGGTEYGHKVTMARSKNLYGPYENHPANPILTHINKDAQLNPIQGTGHADFVEAHDGSWWCVFLAFRPQSGLHHLLGRETFLSPMKWEKGEWPVINDGKPVTLEMFCNTLPLSEATIPPARTDFNEDVLGSEWSFMRNPDSLRYSLSSRPGYLRLYGDTIGIETFGSGVWTGRRQQHVYFTTTVAFEFSDFNQGDEAGLSIYRNASYHYDFYVREEDDGFKSLVLRAVLAELRHTEISVPLSSNKLFLRIEGTPHHYAFLYSIDDVKYETAGTLNTRFLSTETAGGFTGTFLSVFAKAASRTNRPIADIDWFDYICQE